MSYNINIDTEWRI